MYEVNINLKEEYGWKKFTSDDDILLIKGYMYNYNFTQIFNSLKKLNSKNISSFIKSIDGQFSFVFQSRNFTLICVDKIRSIPISYMTKIGIIYIGTNTQKLKEIGDLTFKDINKEQLLSFKMSGYTVADKTLYPNLCSLKAGEFAFIKDSIVEKTIYHRYEPWNVVNKDYNTYLNELSHITLDILKKVIKSANGRQIIIPLSAGNDSRLVASGLKHLGYENILCYSYGTKNNFEAKIAAIISKKLDYEFINIPLTHKGEIEYYSSAEYQDFLNFADTCSSIQCIQSISTIKFLKENKLIEKDAIFINGNSGDFISGGHILGEIQNNHEELDEEARLEIVLNQIIKKHFSLWGNLKTDQNISRVKELLKKELKNENLSVDSDYKVHGVYEYLEFINRQSKFVITDQRVYEFYGYEWRLPLWDDEYLKFWEKVPKEYKINQKLFKEMLKKNNWANVWGDNIPINKKSIVPSWIIPLRFIAKIPFVLFGSKRKDYWHQFEGAFFHYWMDVTHMINVVPYTRVVKDIFRKPRHAVSWMVEDYILKIKNK